MTRPAFINRVRIVGTLTLATDLYLGDGGADECPRGDRGDTADHATVARDAEGRPVVPGAALRASSRATSGIASTSSRSLRAFSARRRSGTQSTGPT